MSKNEGARRVFCLHGFTGAPESWDDALAYFPAGIDVDRPFLLGHDPEDAVAAATFDDEVDRLARRLRGRGWRNVRLAGYSQGGRLALGLLVRHRDLFSSATLVGASPGIATETERQRRRAADERLARLLEDRGLEAFVEHWESLPLFATQRLLPEEKRRRHRAIRLRHRPEGLARALRVLGTGRMPSYWSELPGLGLPVCLMAGERDDKFRRLASRMAELLPRAAVEVVASAGHDLLLEAPERVAAAILRA